MRINDVTNFFYNLPFHAYSRLDTKTPELNENIEELKNVKDRLSTPVKPALTPTISATSINTSKNNHQTQANIKNINIIHNYENIENNSNFQNHKQQQSTNLSKTPSTRSEQGRKTNILRKNSSGAKAENKQRPYVIVRQKTSSRNHNSIGVNCDNLLGDEDNCNFENKNKQIFEHERYLEERVNQKISRLIGP